MIPPYILERIAKNGTDLQKRSARRTLVVSNWLRHQRLAPIPGSHIEGEDRDIHDAENSTDLPGKEVRTEGQPDTQDVAVNEAYDGLGNTFKFFDDILSRHSIDGKGMTMLGSVHVDKDFDNAYWDGSQMCWGDGDIFNRFTIDLDITGHEMTHGITQYTANLDYQDQSGALNEHISDVFGALITQYTYQQTADKASWLIGELLCKGRIQGRALRDMLNPGTAYDDPTIGKDPQPAHMKDIYTGWEDNGGVHINSGIFNRFFALAATQIGGFAWDKAGKIWYKALTERFQSTTDFAQAAAILYAIAGEMYGVGSAEQEAVKYGAGEVGLSVDSPQPNPNPQPAPSPCITEFLKALPNDVRTPLRHFLTHIYSALK